MNDHLRAVENAPESPEAPAPASAPSSTPPPTAGVRRAPQRPRPSRPIPTDRMRTTTARQALQAIALADRGDGEGVTSAHIAARIGVAETTAGLNNAFFREAGWIERRSKGRFVATDATRKYVQRLGFNETEAATLLAPSIKDSWYFREIEPDLALGRPIPVEQAVSVLAQAAGAGAEYRPQLETVLHWLEYVGLILITDGQVQRGQHDIQDLEEVPEPEKPIEQEQQKNEPADTKSEAATKKQHHPDQPSTVVSLDFDLSLTVEDMAKLEPAQITALFEAVGKIVSIKASMT
jgi:hypothetical protein